ncbi:MAG TPA: sulfotransferase [Acidimicrobiia bacterium]|nr:sulfotransferase [Acidimicrobiia bacterium]
MASFVCFYYGATGSTWLLETLNSSPQVWVPGFEPVEPWAWGADDKTKVEWIRTALNPPVGDTQGLDAWWELLRSSPQVTGSYLPSLTSVGFKVSTTALDQTDDLLDVFADLRTPLIFLMRRNRIKHALSLYRYEEEKKSQFLLDGMQPPTRLKFRRFDEWLDRSVWLDQQMSGFRTVCTERLGPDQITTVAYEDLVSEQGKEETISHLCSFLGIDRAGLQPSSVAKATPDDLQDAVINFRRLVRRYRSTPFGVHLTS